MSQKYLYLPEDTKVPNHLAIIPDGNRRWARARGKHTLYGHKKGFDRAIELARAARKWGVHTVTLWGFSTENWDRSEEEINYLMKLYVRLLNKYLKEAHESEVKLVHLGRKDRLPDFLLKKIYEAEQETKHYKKYIANLAIDYGGHDDIIRATRNMVRDGLKPSEIDKHSFEKYLDTHDQPYPYVDLLIRTSGEQRTSGLLLWQMEYAEIYWMEDHFPDFTVDKLKNAILDYSRRRRRFGGNDREEHFKFNPELTAKLEVNWWRLSKIPAGTTFTEYSIAHLKEQWGLSKHLAKDAAKYMVQAFVSGEQKKWDKAGKSLAQFYQLIKEEVKLAFEPALAASLELQLLQQVKSDKETQLGEVEDTTRDLVSEVYRISEFQATKAAHLRALATIERHKAESGKGEEHWDRAEDYLGKYYKALKDRIA